MAACCPCYDDDKSHCDPEQDEIQNVNDQSIAMSQDRKRDNIDDRVKQDHQKETALGVVVDPGKEHRKR